jgi:hypothetical protein
MEWQGWQNKKKEFNVSRLPEKKHYGMDRLAE